MNTMLMLTYGVFLVLLYFMLIYPKNKQAKKIQAMRSALKVGDEVVTIGGAVGTITQVDGEEVTLQTGSNGVVLRMKKWAVGSLNEKRIEQKV